MLFFQIPISMFTILFSALLLFTSNFIDFITLRKIVLHKNRINILTFISCLGALTITLILGFSTSDNPLATLFLILSDFRFWISLVLEFAALTLLRLNYSLNKGNMAAVKMGIFSSIFMVPIVSYMLTDFFNFSSTITINYSSPFQLVLLVSASIFAYILFFSSNKKSSVPHPIALLLMAIILPFAIFMAVKNMQHFNPYLFFALISLSNTILYFVWAIYKKEDFTSIIKHKKDSAFVFTSTMIVFSLFPYIASIISAEFFTILKRIFSIFIAILFDARDKCIKVTNLLSKRQLFSLVLLFCVGIYFQILIA